MADKARKKKKVRNAAPFSEDQIRSRRKFPIGDTVILVALAVIQVCLIVFAVIHNPKPRDVINEYEITVDPRQSGALEITYRFVWTVMGGDDLTWVEVGMPNASFVPDEGSLTGAARSVRRYEDEDYGYASLEVYLDRAYTAGETFEFSFSIVQPDMLCADKDGGYFYELVPCWFNSIPVEHYTFRWKDALSLTESNADSERFSYHLWQGSLDCGGYVPMRVHYNADAFRGAETVEYREFDDSDVENSLRGEKIAIVVLMILLVIVIAVIEVYLIDALVSYDRGRGFLSGYGHRVHLYGMVNPRYRTEKKRQSSSGLHRGYRSGGGCACACACACAGGGRAGCSQKDGFVMKKE